MIRRDSINRGKSSCPPSVRQIIDRFADAGKRVREGVANRSVVISVREMRVPLTRSERGYKRSVYMYTIWARIPILYSSRAGDYWHVWLHQRSRGGDSAEQSI